MTRNLDHESKKEWDTKLDILFSEYVHLQDIMLLI